MDVEFPDGIPGTADHLIDNRVKSRLFDPFRDQPNNCLQPIELVTVGRILEHEGEAGDIQRVVVSRINF